MVPSFIIIFSDDEYDHYGFEKSRESIYAEDIDKEALEKRKRKIEKKYYIFFIYNTSKNILHTYIYIFVHMYVYEDLF